MFDKVLVTVDGSEFAERALEPAFQLARQFGSEVILLRVLTLDMVSLAAGTAPQYYELRSLYEQHDRQIAQEYLNNIIARWEEAGVKAVARVVAGAAPEMILDVAEAAGIDLIIMSTHGRTGLSRLLYGSVAEAVLRGTRWPVLLIPIR